MARNPIFPKTPGENVVDRFLNQTLPRVISEKENANYRAQRDQVADKKWKAQYDLTLENVEKSDNKEAERKRNLSVVQMDQYNNGIDSARLRYTELGTAEALSRFGSIEKNSGYSFYYNNLSFEDKARYLSPDDKLGEINTQSESIRKSDYNYVDFTAPDGTQETMTAAYNKEKQLFYDGLIPFTKLQRMQSYAQSKGMTKDFSMKEGATGMTPSRYEGQFKELTGAIAALKKDVGYSRSTFTDPYTREYIKNWLVNSGLETNAGLPYTETTSTVGMKNAINKRGTKENEAWRDHVAMRTKESLDNIKVQAGLPELFSVSNDSNKELLWQRHAGLLIALDPDLQGMNMAQAYTTFQSDEAKKKSFLMSIHNYLGQDGLDYFQKLSNAKTGLLSVPIKMLHDR